MDNLRRGCRPFVHKRREVATSSRWQDGLQGLGIKVTHVLKEGGMGVIEVCHMESV